MILDQLSTFAQETALAGATGTAKIGRAIDLGDPRNIGTGVSTTIEMRMGKVGLASAGTTATIQLQLVTADTEDLATNPVILQQTPVLPKSSLGAGALIHVGAIPIGAVSKQWLGLRVVRGGEAVTGGTLNAHVTVTPRAWYPHAAATGAEAQ